MEFGCWVGAAGIVRCKLEKAWVVWNKLWADVWRFKVPWGDSAGIGEQVLETTGKAVLVTCLQDTQLSQSGCRACRRQNCDGWDP